MYYEVGRFIALSLVHGGPGPQFFSKLLYTVVSKGVREACPVLEDVMDFEVRNQISCIKEASDLASLNRAVEEATTLLSLCGCPTNVTLETRDNAVEALITFYAVHRSSVALEQLTDGLKMLGIHSLIKLHADLFKEVMCCHQVNLTAAEMKKMFVISLSVPGSNKRATESRVLGFWYDYLQDCEEFQQSTFADDVVTLDAPELLCRDVTPEACSLYIRWALHNNSTETLFPVYVVQMRDRFSGSSWRTLGKGVHDLVPVEQLQPDQEYQFRITAVFQNGFHSRAAVGRWMRTLTAVATPMAPSVVWLESFHPTPDGKALSALVAWEPSDGPSCFYTVVCYAAEIDDFHQKNVVPGQTLWADIEDLKRHKTYADRSLFALRLTGLRHSTNYTVEVMSKSLVNGKVVESSKTSTWFLTPSCLKLHNNNFSICEPSPPDGIRVRLIQSRPGLPADAIIAWKPPINSSPSNRVTNYYVVVNKKINFLEGPRARPHTEDRWLPGNTTSAQIRNLQPGSTYNFSVVAVSIGGRSVAEVVLVHVDGEDDDLIVYSSEGLYILLIPCFLVLFVIFGFFFLYRLYRKRKIDQNRRKYFESLDQRMPPVSNELSIAALKSSNIKEDYEVDFSAFQIAEVLGQGAFGVVRKAQLTLPLPQSWSTIQTVAVKMLKPNAPPEDRQQLLQEIETLRNLPRHSHVVNLMACCSVGENICLAVEYCPLGDLQSFLRCLRQEYLELRANFRGPRLRLDSGVGQNSEGNIQYTQVVSLAIRPGSGSTISSYSQGQPNFYVNGSVTDEEGVQLSPCSMSPADLVAFARQVALGMEHLARNKFVHRDLAARNILVCDHKLVKISDFGLSRDVYEQGFYQKMTGGKLPVKWMALESIMDQSYTTKSDVWSFGILLWEIATLGGIPYPGLDGPELIKMLKNGYRMPKPDNCSDDIYILMRECWKTMPLSRPGFNLLRERLEKILEGTAQYMTFDLDGDADYYCTNESGLNGNDCGGSDSAFIDKNDSSLTNSATTVQSTWSRQKSPTDAHLPETPYSNKNATVITYSDT